MKNKLKCYFILIIIVFLFTILACYLNEKFSVNQIIFIPIIITSTFGLILAKILKYL